MKNIKLSTFGKLNFFLFLIFLAPLLLVNLEVFNSNQIEPVSTPYDRLNEVFDETLEFLNSQDKLHKYFQEQIQENNFTDIEMIIFADDLLRKRFRHGDVVVNQRDNWVLYVFNYLSGNSENSLYTSALNPNVILNSPQAICNQQAIIFQGLMRSIGFEYMSINFNVPSSEVAFGHFASGVKVKDDWYFVDTNIEPQFNRTDPTIVTKLLSNDLEIFNSLYSPWAVPAIPNGSIYSSSLNEFPAKKGKFLQDFTYFLSNYVWVFFLCMGFACYFRVRGLDAE